MRVFGPVPSRRLGRSMGINNIPPKICSYSCVYCQLGRSLNMSIERKMFYKPEELVGEVKEKLNELSPADMADYLTFVPDGEPTLDINLGKEITLLKPLKIKIAVISNSSLIWRDDVQQDLALTDWLSLKVDSVVEESYKKINRPHGSLKLADILGGIIKFSRTFKGMLVTESMIVKGVNDSREDLEKLAEFLRMVKPAKAYISIPTRPPAEEWVEQPDEEAIHLAYQIINSKVGDTEYLINYEGNSFSSTGELEEDILSITAVHPMREEAIESLLRKRGGSHATIEKLLSARKLIKVAYGGNIFYVRRFTRR